MSSSHYTHGRDCLPRAGWPLNCSGNNLRVTRQQPGIAFCYQLFLYHLSVRVILWGLTALSTLPNKQQAPAHPSTAYKTMPKNCPSCSWRRYFTDTTGELCPYTYLIRKELQFADTEIACQSPDARAIIALHASLIPRFRMTASSKHALYESLKAQNLS